MAILINSSNTKDGFFCYLHKRADGTVFYVGKGKYRRAISLSPLDRPKNHHHANIIAKEGEENIIIELISAIDEKDAFRLEILYIAELNPSCNFTAGGEGISGYRHTEETKLILSKASSGKNGYYYGQHLTKKHRNNIAKGNKGKPKSEIAKINMKKSCHHNGKDNPMYGKHQSKESKLKMAGENNYNAKLTWVIVKEIRVRYEAGGITQAALAREYDITTQHINDILLNKRWKEVQ